MEKVHNNFRTSGVQYMVLEKNWKNEKKTNEPEGLSFNIPC